jgi:hypothetical protein
MDCEFVSHYMAKSNGGRMLAGFTWHRIGYGMKFEFG